MITGFVEHGFTDRRGWNWIWTRRGWRITKGSPFFGTKETIR